MPSRQSKGRKSEIRRVAFQDTKDRTKDPDAIPTETGAAEGAFFPLGSTDPSVIDNSQGLTFEAFEEMAMRNNPAILQAAASASQASGFREQVGLKPNPTVGYFGDEIGDNGAGGLHGLFLSQTFVSGEKLALNRHVLEHDVRAALSQVDVQRRRVRTEIRNLFVAALANQQRIELARQFKAVAEKGVRAAESRFEAGEGTRADILQSEIQVSEVEVLVRQAEFALQGAWNELTAVAGVPEMPFTGLLGSLDMAFANRDLETEYSRIVSESPIVAAANERVYRAQANLERQRSQSVPNINTQLGAGHDSATGDQFANVQFSLAIPVHNENQGNIDAAHAEYCRATQDARRVKLQIRQALAQKVRQFKSAEAAVEQFETTVIPKADEALALVQKAQEIGEVNFFRVLTARKTFFDVQLRYINAKTELAQADAAIDGLLLTDGLANPVTYDVSDDLRGQSLSVQ
ncbi:MAG: TolC family protein [Planctomycetaceae bacterium]